jgi:protein ImuB
MRRVVSLFLPYLPTDLLCRRGGLPAGPLVTSLHDGRRLTIGAANATAAGLGLRPGLPIGEAQARLPGLTVVPGTPERDAASLRRIARLCLRYAPLTAPAPLDGVWIDATGSAHLFGGERRLLSAIVTRFTADGITARAAIAGTPGAAHAVARHGALTDGIAVVPADGERAALEGLPVEALRLDAETCRELRALGLATIGAMLDMPRGPLARRFGTGVGLRLDQALGRCEEPIRPLAPPRAIAARLGFVEPLLTAEAFAAVIGRLVDEVCGRLETAGLGARRLELAFERVDGSVQTARVVTARPVRDRGQLGRLLCERIETVDPGLGVEAMRLSVRGADRFGAIQLGGGCDAVGDVAPLIDTLVNRLGPGRVWRPVLVQSDVPERSVGRVLALEGPGGAPPADSGGADPKRPVRLLDPPQPVDVMALLPDHPPASFVWRRVRHRVRHADGPERIAGEWWRRDGEVDALRDYFRIEDEDGRRFWLFRRGDGADPATGDMRWFLHGLF